MGVYRWTSWAVLGRVPPAMVGPNQKGIRGQVLAGIADSTCQRNRIATDWLSLSADFRGIRRRVCRVVCAATSKALRGLGLVVTLS